VLDDTKRTQFDDNSGLDHTAILPGMQSTGIENNTEACLIVLAGWEIGRELRLVKESTTFGRSTLADSLINAPSVSRLHARIDKLMKDRETQYVITDLGSSNGVYINNQRTENAILNANDKLRMGDVLFKFVLLDEVDARYHQEVQRLIYYDSLTGLMTMEAFRPELELAIRHAKQKETVFSLAMTDMDGLKRVNDTHGHLAGRMVVREMGAILRSHLRKQDIGALYGGDEAVLLFRATPLTEAVAQAEKIRKAIEDREFIHHETVVRVTLSQGLAEWPRHGTSADSLIAAADKALYKAKELGRNRVCTPE